MTAWLERPLSLLLAWAFVPGSADGQRAQFSRPAASRIASVGRRARRLERLIYVLLLICGLLIFAAPASAWTLYAPTGEVVPPFYTQALGQMKMPQVPVPLLIRQKNCNSTISTPGDWSCAFMTRNEIWMAPNHQKESVLFHELGHNFDAHMSDQARNEFRAIFGYSDPWFEGNKPGELFAEAYGRCALYSPDAFPTGRATAYGYNPSYAQEVAVCQLIIAEASRNGWLPGQAVLRTNFWAEQLQEQAEVEEEELRLPKAKTPGVCAGWHGRNYRLCLKTMARLRCKSKAPRCIRVRRAARRQLARKETTASHQVALPVVTR